MITWEHVHGVATYQVALKCCPTHERELTDPPDKPLSLVLLLSPLCRCKSSDTLKVKD